MNREFVLRLWLNHVVVPLVVPTVSFVTDLYIKTSTPILFIFSFILISLYTFLLSCSIYMDIKRSVTDPSLVPTIHVKSKFINSLLTVISLFFILHLILLPSPSIFVVVPFIVLITLVPTRYIFLSYLSTLRYIGKKPTRGVGDIVTILAEIAAAVISYITTHWLVSVLILTASFLSNFNIIFEIYGDGGDEKK